MLTLVTICFTRPQTMQVQRAAALRRWHHSYSSTVSMVACLSASHDGDGRTISCNMFLMQRRDALAIRSVYDQALTTRYY